MKKLAVLLVSLLMVICSGCVLKNAVESPDTTEPSHNTAPVEPMINPEDTIKDTGSEQVTVITDDIDQKIKDAYRMSAMELIEVFPTYDGAPAEALFDRLSRFLMENVIDVVNLIAESELQDDLIDLLTLTLGATVAIRELPDEEVQILYMAQNSYLTERQASVLDKIISGYENEKASYNMRLN